LASSLIQLHEISEACAEAMEEVREIAHNLRPYQLRQQKPTLNDLTPTERRILQLIAAYQTSREIAEELCISHRTVETHRANICAKLEIHGSHALMKFALAHQAEL
jgi:DNA-binding NarL/FixJ family response regulator